jgi:hypothetical protein
MSADPPPDGRPRPAAPAAAGASALGAPDCAADAERDARHSSFLREVVEGPDFFRGFFRERRRPRAARRHAKVLEPVQVWQGHAIQRPLMRGLPDALQPLALEAFRLILVYSGVERDAKPAAAAGRLLELVHAHPPLRDEAFFQLIKQVGGSANEDCRRRTWELFLIVATTMPASPESEPEICENIGRHVDARDAAVALFAQFCFIRFRTRCALGAPLWPLSAKEIAVIPTQIAVRRISFSGSIYEHLIVQRAQYPRMPVPLIIYLLARALLQGGCLTARGLFRISGEATVVSSMITDIDSTHDVMVVLKGKRVHDLATAFKLWFTRLPVRIVPPDCAGLLREVHQTTKDYMKFLEDLPPAHVTTLKFLCGFLKEVATAEAETQMGLRNLVLIFSASLVHLPEIDDPLTVSAHAEVAQEFMMTLLDKWDTSDIYPIPEALLR